MKLVVCGSMKFYDVMNKAKSSLEQQGHSVVIPEIGEKELGDDRSSKEWRDYKKGIIIAYNKKISQTDAVLIMNIDNKGVANYIGSNTLMELAVAFAHEKKIFLLNPIPDQPFKEELEAIDPVILNGDLSAVKG